MALVVTIGWIHILVMFVIWGVCNNNMRHPVLTLRTVQTTVLRIALTNSILALALAVTIGWTWFSAISFLIHN